MTLDASDRVRIIEGREGFESLGAAWNLLAGGATTTPFQSLAWARAWLATIGQDATPWVIAVGDPIQALLPLAFETRRGIRRVRLLGHGVSDYLGTIPLQVSEKMIRTILRTLREAASRFDLLQWQGLFGSLAESQVIQQCLGGSVLQRLYERCPFISTDRDWEAYLGAQTRKFRANLKRTVRRTEALGKVITGLEPPSPELFQELSDVERESWKWQDGFAMLRHRDKNRFLNRVLLETDLPAEIWCCRVDGRLASFAIVFPHHHVRHYYLPSFRAEFPDTGTYLLRDIVRASCTSSVREVDLLQGDEHYKKTWASSQRTVSEVVWGSPGIRGHLASSAVALRWALARSPRIRAARRRILIVLGRIIDRNTAEFPTKGLREPATNRAPRQTAEK